MKDNHKRKKHNHSEKSKKEESSCFYMVDDCGCVVGSYCCDGPDMKSCQYQCCC